MTSDFDVCPRCEEEFFRHVKLDEETSIDTMGMVFICATEYGAFFHPYDSDRYEEIHAR